LNLWIYAGLYALCAVLWRTSICHWNPRWGKRLRDESFSK
jgi:hypothetical protein